MKRTIGLLVAIALVSTLILTACGSAAGVPKVDWTVKVSGAVSKPMTLAFKDLAKRPQVTLKDVLMRRSQGEDTKNSWEGPSVMAILKDAGVSVKAKGVVCSATDGYAKELTVDELKDAIIALKQDGKWISPNEKGPIRLVVPDKPANSWIAGLVELKVSE